MIAVLVTTQHRGVFFGLVREDQDLNARTMSLQNARCAIRFGTTRGFAELAETGPTPQSRVGAPADIVALHDITAVLKVTDQAKDKWLNA